MDDRTIALVALFVSISVGLWQDLQYVFEGARVRIRMSSGLLSDYALSRSVRSWSNVERMARRDGGWYVEVAKVEIENVSRTAITISEVSLDLGRTSRFRLGRRTTGPQALRAPDASQERTPQLEPFDRCTHVFDVWRAVHGIEQDRFAPVEFPIRLRASVRSASRWRRSRSPRWRESTVIQGQLTSFSRPTEISPWPGKSSFATCHGTGTGCCITRRLKRHWRGTGAES